MIWYLLLKKERPLNNNTVEEINYASIFFFFCFIAPCQLACITIIFSDWHAFISCTKELLHLATACLWVGVLQSRAILDLIYDVNLELKIIVWKVTCWSVSPHITHFKRCSSFIWISGENSQSTEGRIAMSKSLNEACKWGMLKTQ